MSISIKELLDTNEMYRDYLYAKGFVITTDTQIDLNGYPFYKKWNSKTIDGYVFITHRRTSLHQYYDGKRNFFLLGHAYNPFTMVADENVLLKEVSDAFDSDRYFEKINEFTGIFIIGYIGDNHIYFCGDATCTQTSYYGVVDNEMYIASHTMLLEDILDIRKSDYINKLVSYKHYQLFGIMLPGDLSPYKEFTRTVPNFEICYSGGGFSKKRFWPVKEIKTDADYTKIVHSVAKILHNNLELIAKEYPNKRAAISMTGGCDSKTTLSCANGMYGSFQYFSYASSDSEKVDLDAASKIAGMLGIEHKKYYISENDADFPDLNIWKALIDQNTGNIGHKHSNDYRKRVYFVNHHDFDVEVKSWASEIGRAYYNKRFSMKKFPEKVTPRYLSTLYKVFTYQRKLLMETDKVFSQYLKEYYNDDIFEKVSWTDLIFWEYRYSAWNSLSTSQEHILSYDITIPYNNRILLENLLRTPLEYRIDDRCHKDIQRLMNKNISESGVRVVNVKHTSNRAKIERMYLKINTLLPY